MFALKFKKALSVKQHMGTLVRRAESPCERNFFMPNFWAQMKTRD